MHRVHPARVHPLEIALREFGVLQIVDQGCSHGRMMAQRGQPVQQNLP
jgi:hypothetical protein